LGIGSYGVIIAPLSGAKEQSLLGHQFLDYLSFKITGTAHGHHSRLIVGQVALILLPVGHTLGCFQVLALGILADIALLWVSNHIISIAKGSSTSSTVGMSSRGAGSAFIQVQIVQTTASGQQGRVPRGASGVQSRHALTLALSGTLRLLPGTVHIHLSIAEVAIHIGIQGRGVITTI